jgi:hypothetical protein
MCSTPWCWGECDDCIRQAKLDKEWEEEHTDCPHRKECTWVTLNVKTDKCTTCGLVTNY